MADPISAVGQFVGAFSVLISGYASPQDLKDIVLLRTFRDQLLSGRNAVLVVRYGFFKASLLLWACPDALALMERVEQSVLVEGDQGAKMMKDSMTANYNMIAVAGAIIAQVAISALSLDRVSQTHWTAQAAFVTSLVSGALSVYYAFVVQQTAGSLIKPDELKDWLTGSRTSDTALQTAIQRRAREIRLGSHTMMTPDQVKELLELATTEQGYHKPIPSVTSALILVAPGRMLNIAVAAFLLGLGIYRGFACSNHFLSDGGPNASLAILIFYIVTAILGLLVFYIPFGVKAIDMVSRQRSARDARPVLEQVVQQLAEALEVMNQAPDEHRADLLRDFKMKRNSW